MERLKLKFRDSFRPALGGSSGYFRQGNDGAATAFPTGQVQPEFPARLIQPSQQDE